MVPLWLENPTPTTLRLKNIPDDVYERLKLAAETHRRRIDREAIVFRACLRGRGVFVVGELAAALAALVFVHLGLVAPRRQRQEGGIQP